MLYAKKCFLLLVGTIFLFGNLFFICAFMTSSSTYSTDVIESSGGGEINSSSYQNDIIVGTISGNSNSQNYNTSLGFFYGTGAVVSNNPPTNPSSEINSSDGTNYENQNLNCFSLINDLNNDNLDVSVRWYKNSILQISQTYTSYASGSNFNSVLLEGNTSAGDIWKCSLRLYDGKEYSDWVNSSSLTVLPIPGGGGEISGGGGAPGVTYVTYNFSVDKDLIKTFVKQGSVQRETIEIINTGTGDLSFSLDYEKIGNFLIASEKNFILKPGESKVIKIDFFAKDEQNPDIYAGRILINANGITKIINVVLEVKEKRPLFDVVTQLKKSTLYPGDKLEANIKLVNVGDLHNFDVKLYYAIKDFNNSALTFKEESLAIDKELNIDRELKIPNDIGIGDYVFYVKVSYGEITATGSEVIKIAEKEHPSKVVYMLIILILICLITIVLILIVRRKKDKKDIKQT